MLNLFIGTLMVIGCLLPPIIHFERRKIKAEEIVLIALMSAIAAVSRVPFASLPSVQPTSFVIMVTAYVFGAETGLLVGAIAALVSNMFLGQGPWTPWQMFCWGMIGLSSGLLRNTVVMKKWLPRLIFGLLWGFVFGWIMNLWMVIQYDASVSLKAWLVYGISSFYFDLNHGLSNVFFTVVFFRSWSHILGRVKKKYMTDDDERLLPAKGKNA